MADNFSHYVDTNASFNSSVGSNAEVQRMLRFVNSMEITTIPVIVIIGVIGNVLSAIVFFQPMLRKTSCSLYMGARAITDIGFLTTLFIIWLANLKVDVFLCPGMCQAEVFLSYLCAFLSVWYVAWMTVENYYRICRPFKVSTFCTVKRARCVIVITTIIGCAFYGVSVVTNTTMNYKGLKVCSWANNYILINHILSYGDTIVTLLLPSSVIILTTGRILYSLIVSCRRAAGNTLKGSGALQTKVTRLLFFVSFTFLLLNLPSHIIRIKLILDSLIGNKARVTTTDYLLQHLFQQVYYLSFSVNFFIYVSLGESFRKTCFKLFCEPLEQKLQRRKNGMDLPGSAEQREVREKVMPATHTGTTNV